jgi:hypothetical protein
MSSKGLALVPREPALLWRPGGSVRLATTLRCCIVIGRAGRDHVLLFLSEKDAANLRFKIGFVLRKLVAQMLARKFERHELVMIVCAP